MKNKREGKVADHPIGGPFGVSAELRQKFHEAVDQVLNHGKPEQVEELRQKLERLTSPERTSSAKPVRRRGRYAKYVHGD